MYILLLRKSGKSGKNSQWAIENKIEKLYNDIEKK